MKFASPRRGYPHRFQEALLAQALQQGDVADFWRDDAAAADRMADRYFRNTFRVGGGNLGAALATRRTHWKLDWGTFAAREGPDRSMETRKSVRESFEGAVAALCFLLDHNNALASLEVTRLAGPTARRPELVAGDACDYMKDYRVRVVGLDDNGLYSVDYPGAPARLRRALTNAAGGRAATKGLLGALKRGRCAGLRTLKLVGCNCGPEGAKALAKALAACPALTELDAEDNHLGPDGALALAPALKAQPRGLVKLGLAANDLCFRDVVLDEESRMIFGTADGGGVAALCEALEGHFTLESLDLSDNHLGVLAEAVDPQKWERIDFSWNFGGASQTAEFAALTGARAVVGKAPAFWRSCVFDGVTH